MSCRHDLALGTCSRCYSEGGTRDPGPESDYDPNMEGPGAVPIEEYRAKMFGNLPTAMSDNLKKALVSVATGGRDGVTCSMLGLDLYPTTKPSTNRAREGGAVLHRLRKLGLVERGQGNDGVHSTWTLTASGRLAVEPSLTSSGK